MPREEGSWSQAKKILRNGEEKLAEVGVLQWQLERDSVGRTGEMLLVKLESEHAILHCESAI